MTVIPADLRFDRGCQSRAASARNAAAGSVGAEDARAGDEELGAGVARLVDRLERDAAVDLEHDLGGQQRAQAGEPRSVEDGM